MLRQIQLLAGAMMSSLILIAVVVASAAPGDDRFAAPPMWLLAAQFGAGAALFVLIETFGYRTGAFDPETEQTTTADALAAFQNGTIMRFALSEVVALGSLAAAFVIEEGGITGYATGAVVSLALMGYHAWPWSRPVDKTVAQLERDGGRSGLREGLGLPPKLSGAITEL